jgi:hypothetical protein
MQIQKKLIFELKKKFQSVELIEAENFKNDVDLVIYVTNKVDNTLMT